MFRCFFRAMLLNCTRFIGQNPGIMEAETRTGGSDDDYQILGRFAPLERGGRSAGRGVRTLRDQLSLAGLSEEELRKMDPDDRMAALEQANLDPYDFIYLAC